MYHKGRGSQESVFGELKSQSQPEYIPVRYLCGNQLYMIAAIMAHNLNRGLQMATATAERGTTVKGNSSGEKSRDIRILWARGRGCWMYPSMSRLNMHVPMPI